MLIKSQRDIVLYEITFNKPDSDCPFYMIHGDARFINHSPRINSDAPFDELYVSIDGVGGYTPTMERTLISNAHVLMDQKNPIVTSQDRNHTFNIGVMPDVQSHQDALDAIEKIFSQAIRGKYESDVCRDN